MLILLVLIFKLVVDDVELLKPVVDDATLLKPVVDDVALLKPVVDEVRLPNTKPVVENEVGKQKNNYIHNLIFYHVTDFP